MTRILFIGNSHTYFNDMPALFLEECAARGIEAEAVMLALGGVGLDEHARQPQTRFNILYGHYDVVVLQHRAHPMGEIEDMLAGGEAIQEWIRSAGARTILYQTWAAKGDEDYQPTMSAAYARLAALLGAEIAPVGDQWQAWRRAHPRDELYAEDGQHASPAGSRLAARVLLATIFGDRD